ncbi:MAG: ABC transporter permease [Bacteroidales bacterium]|nr:ABC transporter permease [Bacteroidales bacterium]
MYIVNDFDGGFAGICMPREFGGLGLTGTMTTNVMERSREVGVMRAIGASDWAVFRLVITEGLVIGFISWLLGSLVAFPISMGLGSLLESYSFPLAYVGSIKYSANSCSRWRTCYVSALRNYNRSQAK